MSWHRLIALFKDTTGNYVNGNIDAGGNIKVAVTGAGSGGTSAVDESAFTAGVSAGTPVIGVYEAVPTPLTNGQQGIVGLTPNREMKVSGSFSSTPITAATRTLSSVSDSASSVTLLAANAARLAFRIYNDSDSVLFIKGGATASATSFTEKVLPGQSWGTREIGVNDIGKLDGIWASAPGGAARVTEWTA